MENVKLQFGDSVEFCKDEYDAAKGADALFIMTEWPVFRTPEFERLKTILKAPMVFDGRNVYETNAMEEVGFTYFSIGRRNIN